MGSTIVRRSVWGRHMAKLRTPHWADWGGRIRPTSGQPRPCSGQARPKPGPHRPSVIRPSLAEAGPTSSGIAPYPAGLGPHVGPNLVDVGPKSPQMAEIATCGRMWSSFGHKTGEFGRTRAQIRQIWTGMGDVWRFRPNSGGGSEKSVGHRPGTSINRHREPFDKWPGWVGRSH